MDGSRCKMLVEAAFDVCGRGRHLDVLADDACWTIISTPPTAGTYSIGGVRRPLADVLRELAEGKSVVVPFD